MPHHRKYINIQLVRRIEENSTQYFSQNMNIGYCVVRSLIENKEYARQHQRTNND